MPFHEDDRVQKLVQNHIDQISSLEEDKVKLLQKRYKAIRQDLRDRLDVIGSGTFTAQRLRSILLQVETALEAMRKGLQDEMSAASTEAAILGSEDLIREVERFDNIFTGAAREINVDTVLVSSQTTNYLFNRHEASLEAYSADLRSNISRRMSDLAIQEVPTSQIVSDLGKFFLGEEWKLMRLARTEVHHTYNLSRQNTLFRVAADDNALKKTLFHPMDHRTDDDSKQAAAKELVVAVDEPFQYTFRRKRSDGSIVEVERVFMVPPDRPNDRSIMVPYKKSWD